MSIAFRGSDHFLVARGPIQPSTHQIFHGRFQRSSSSSAYSTDVNLHLSFVFPRVADICSGIHVVRFRLNSLVRQIFDREATPSNFVRIPSRDRYLLRNSRRQIMFVFTRVIDICSTSSNFVRISSRGRYLLRNPRCVKLLELLGNLTKLVARC